MKKTFILAAAAVLLISGCNTVKTTDSSSTAESLGAESSGKENSTTEPTDITVIKWGVDKFAHDETECMAELNEQLSAEGSNIRVELIELDMGFDPEMTFSKQILDYEKENGSLDIVTYGGDWQDKIGAAYGFFESGYFVELGEKDTAQFTDIPKICWDAAKVNGKCYTVPALSYGLNDQGLYFYFNTKFISEDKAKGFNGDFAKLEELLDGAAFGEKTTHLEFQLDYLDFALYTPASVKGGLYISDKTMTAFDPYENEEVIEYARTLNRLYKAGHMNYDIDFSDYDESENIDTDFAMAVFKGQLDEQDLNKRLGEAYSVVVYSQPYYMESRLLYSTGIPANSAHPDEAMELLKRLHSDKEFSGLLSESERGVIGLPRNNEPVEIGEVKLSPFADFELKYTDIDGFKDVSTLCQDSFDKLCKAEDFDKTLAEIVAELKAAGIDDYVARVNQRLEENRDSSNQ